MSQQRPSDFQALTLRSTGVAKSLTSPVHITEAFDPDQLPDPPPQAANFQALWDTGATGSVITDQVAKALNLVPTGTARVNHAMGCDDANTYVVNIGMPNGVMFCGVQVHEGKLAGVDVLIGMDIITVGDLSLTHVGGKTCMSFRTPTLGGHDFVQESKDNGTVHAAPTPGRNSPCPCRAKRPNGTPKKYKDCCGRAA